MESPTSLNTSFCCKNLPCRFQPYLVSTFARQEICTATTWKKYISLINHKLQIPEAMELVLVPLVYYELSSIGELWLGSIVTSFPFLLYRFFSPPSLRCFNSVRKLWLMTLSLGERSADRYRFDHLVLVYSLNADLSMADLLCSLLSETRRRRRLDDNFPSLTALLIMNEYS